MTAFEDRSAATPLRMIAKYGKTITLQRAGAKVYDPTTGENTGGTPPAPETIKGVVNDFSARIDRIGLTIKSGDKEILVAASGFVKPTIADTFQVDSDVFTIVPVHEGGLEVVTHYAGEVPVIYKIHGRKI